MNFLPNACIKTTLAALMAIAMVGAPVWADDGAKEVAKSKADQTSPKTGDKKTGDKKTRDKKPGKDWTLLRGSWKACQFGGDGEIEIGKNTITMDYGDPITGVHWDGDVLRDNYEIELQGRRMDGFDFFCALTFPIGEKGRASLVMGGWGGGTMGISSINERDASDNETTVYRDFKNKQWYTARVRVETTRVAVWIDDSLQYEVPRKDRKFDIRYEMDPCLPLGLACFQCKSEIRNVRWRKLNNDELGKPLKSKKLAKEKEEKKEAAIKEAATKEAAAQ